MSEKQLPLRKEIKAVDKWNIENMYKTNEVYLEQFESIKELKSIEMMNRKYKGKLVDLEVKEFRKIYEIYFKEYQILEKMYSYCSMQKDVQLNDDLMKDNYQKIKKLYNKFAELTSWIDPEILALDDKKLKEISDSEEMKDFKMVFDDTVRSKEHICSKEIEEVLVLSSNPLGCLGSIYSMLSDNDLEFGKILDKNNKELTLTKGNFMTYLESDDRVLRENSFKKIHLKYKEFENTFSELFNSIIQRNIFSKKVRKYNSCLEKKLFGDNIDVKVYKSLIEVTREEISCLHNYIKLRKKILNLDGNLHLYDLYVPLIKEEKVDKYYEFDEAVDLCIKSTHLLGKEYQEKLECGLKKERWVDKFENKGKRSGAYSGGSYKEYPYILLNYKGRMSDIFTLIHESGHSMHSYYSNENQKIQDASYSHFVAEVASIFNEMSLSDYLLTNSKSDKEKLYLLNKLIENIRTTYFRQVLFADFELQVFEAAERGESITPNFLRDLYYKIYKFYYGEDVEIDEEVQWELFRIPHFFLYHFYVFQYATGISASLFLHDKVKNGGETERENYLSFLKAGSSDYPINILKNAGIDITSKDAFKKTITKFKQLIIEFESLYDKLTPQ